MPQLPVPFPVLPDSGDLPVSTTADVLAAFPAFTKGDTPAPVRDAIVEAELAMCLGWQEAAGYAAAQSDPTRATGIYLDGHAGDREVFRQDGEEDEPFRDRMFSTPEVVTPEAILAAADTVLARYTSKRAQYFESVLDSMFLEDGTASWHCFFDTTPDYPSRLYEKRPQSKPGMAWISDTFGRYLILRVPVLEGLTDAHAFLYDGTVDETASPGKEGVYLFDGTEANHATECFLFTSGATALEVYRAIANSINAIRGHGIRWQLYADPNL